MWLRRITDEEYDRFYQSFRDQISDFDTRLALLQEAEDNYYITAKYLLDLANRAYDLFESSELEEKRQLIKLVLQNLRLEGKTVQFEAIKPFDTLLSYNDHQPLLSVVDMFKNREIEFGFTFQNIQTVFDTFKLSYPN